MTDKNEGAPRPSNEKTTVFDHAVLNPTGHPEVADFLNEFEAGRYGQCAKLLQGGSFMLVSSEVVANLTGQIDQWQGLQENTALQLRESNRKFAELDADSEKLMDVLRAAMILSAPLLKIHNEIAAQDKKERKAFMSKFFDKLGAMGLGINMAWKAGKAAKMISDEMEVNLVSALFISGLMSDENNSLRKQFDLGKNKMSEAIEVVKKREPAVYAFFMDMGEKFSSVTNSSPLKLEEG